MSDNKRKPIQTHFINPVWYRVVNAPNSPTGLKDFLQLDHYQEVPGSNTKNILTRASSPYLLPLSRVVGLISSPKDEAEETHVTSLRLACLEAFNELYIRGEMTELIGEEYLPQNVIRFREVKP